jgi:hypothetical protein
VVCKLFDSLEYSLNKIARSSRLIERNAVRHLIKILEG